MQFIDISMPISPLLQVYPGDPPAELDPLTSISEGDDANVTRLLLTTHTGTHLDPPRHFFAQGVSVDEIPLSTLIGEALVAELPGVGAIGVRELKQIPLAGVKRLLLKTGNSSLWDKAEFIPAYAHLTQDGAQYLCETGVRLVGIDYLSIEQFGGDGAVHRTLLGHGIVILEGLNLSGVTQGQYELICLPLKITGGDGAPVRALLKRREGL